MVSAGWQPAPIEIVGVDKKFGCSLARQCRQPASNNRRRIGMLLLGSASYQFHAPGIVMTGQIVAIACTYSAVTNLL